MSILNLNMNRRGRTRTGHTMLAIASHKRLASTVLAMTLLGTGCATTPDYSLPAIDDASATATVRVKVNPDIAPQAVQHLLLWNGETILSLLESEKREFQVNPGEHTATVTCHFIPYVDGAGYEPPNLNVIDGKTSLQLSLSAGDETCLFISRGLMNCGQMEDAVQSKCE